MVKIVKNGILMVYNKRMRVGPQGGDSPHKTLLSPPPPPPRSKALHCTLVLHGSYIQWNLDKTNLYVTKASV